MLGAILGSGEGCVATPESQFKTDALDQFGRRPSRFELPRILEFIKGHFRFGLWGVDVPESEAWLAAHASYSEMLQGLVDLYAERVDTATPSRWVDHTPRNRKYVGDLFAHFPEAVFIHLVRDGRAVAASLLPLTWGPSSIGHAAEFWLQSLAAGLAAELRYPSRVIRVHYEDLVREPETTLLGLCQRLSVTYSESMLSGAGFEVPAYTKQQHALVGRKPDAAAVTRWTRELSERQVEIFESIAGGVLEDLGYPCLSQGPRRRQSPVSRLIDGDLRLSARGALNTLRQGMKMLRSRDITPRRD